MWRNSRSKHILICREGLYNCPPDQPNKQDHFLMSLSQQAEARQTFDVQSALKIDLTSIRVTAARSKGCGFIKKKEKNLKNTQHLKAIALFLSLSLSLSSHVVKSKLYGATLLPADWPGCGSDPTIWFVVAKQWGAIESENKTAWSW